MDKVTERIRWEPADGSGWDGKVGTLEPWVFGIWESKGAGWALETQIPGAIPEPGVIYRDDPADLKAEAERLLDRFVSSLGAVFKPEPDESAAFQVREARSVLARWDAGRDDPDGVIYDRERVLADQVKALIAIADKGAGQ